MFILSMRIKFASPLPLHWQVCHQKTCPYRAPNISRRMIVCRADSSWISRGPSVRCWHVEKGTKQGKLHWTAYRVDDSSLQCKKNTAKSMFNQNCSHFSGCVLRSASDLEPCWAHSPPMHFFFFQQLGYYKKHPLPVACETWSCIEMGWCEHPTVVVLTSSNLQPTMFSSAYSSRN